MITKRKRIRPKEIKIYPFSWIKRIDAKMTIISKALHRFTTIPIKKIPMIFFKDLNRSIYIYENSPSNPRQKRWVASLSPTLLSYKTIITMKKY